jgi:hypothetical protein
LQYITLGFLVVVVFLLYLFKKKLATKILSN